MKETNYKKSLSRAAEIFRAKLTYKSCLVFLLCAYCLFVVTGTPNIAYRLIGIVIFSSASIAVFYKFYWVKYFFYAWTFITLCSVFFIDNYFKCSTHSHGFASIWMVVALVNASQTYALGRLINRIEPKKLTENWIDVLAIASFISILCILYTPDLAGYINNVFHFIPSTDTIFERAEESLNWESTYAKWGLFLWPEWLLDIIVTVCLAFLLTLPFYRLWRLKHSIIAASFIPVVDFIPILICFAYGESYFRPGPFLWDKFVIPLGVLIGGLCTVFLKKILIKNTKQL